MDALVDDFSARRPGGFDRAYALWSRVLFSVARHVLGDDARAEDCVHDALLRVWNARNTFEGDRAMLRGYLIASVRNHAIASSRSESRRAARELRAARLSPQMSDDAPVVDPVETQRVRDALARLPDEQRTAIVHAYYRNQTQAEISQELGVPLGTIKSRIAMAMRKLQTELAVSAGADA